MLGEINCAADFLIQLLRVEANVNRLDEAKLQMFKASLSSLLLKRYRGHWFPEHPNKGSAYRCIRINTKMDPIINQVGDLMGLPNNYLRYMFPNELTLWIDPSEVSYRIGENGSICILFEGAKAEPATMPPRQSPELYLDPRQYDQIDPMVDFLGFSW